MSGEADDSGPAKQRGGSDFSRRDLLKRAGMLGAATAVQVGGLAPAGAAEPARKVAQLRAAMPVRESLETLTAAESDTLEAIVARLIPTDENGPGAAEARAAHYIDRALTGPLASSRAAYSAGLAAVDAYARASKGAPFANLSAKDQDSILSDMRSEEHTSELQSLAYLVCRLLLEKKNERQVALVFARTNAYLDNVTISDAH